MTTPPFNPLPCGDGAGGDAAADVEQNLLCEIDAEGNLIGTALAVYEYDENGNPVGPPTFVDPITGDPYVVTTGTLQPCPDGTSMGPVQFCQTGTSTAPAEHPGRTYDITLPINPGFAVDSLIVDAVTHNAGITWEVDDPDGAAFATALDAFITARLPSGTTVTVTNPNAGVQQVCGAAAPMQIHIECLRLDQSPPNLIELAYNAGQDMVQNPAYNEFPALNPPVSQGNYGFHLLSRQDDPGPFPGNPPAGDALCTNVANRGWETNDIGRTFEIWGKDVADSQNTTPTPRGTPVQEMASDGAPPGGRSTIWQTFVAPASGNFIIRVVHGARDAGEQHRITLDNGDTGPAQNGDLIDDNTNPPSVTSSGGPNPWTQFNQTIPLNSGSTYTLALSVGNNGGGARGGLFTDMRAYIDRPGQRATAVNDDETCTVTVDETSTTTTCSFWQPQSAGGDIVGWERLDTGLTLTNGEFWAQVPTPSCCALTAASDGGTGGTTNANLVVSDTVCVIQGGISTNAIRQVVLDPSGGQLSQQFFGPDGVPVTPDSWTAGACTTNRTLFDVMLCDFGAPDAQGQPTVFMRKFVQSLSATLQGNVNSHRDFLADGTGTYTVVGPVRDCASATQVDREAACWTTTAGGATVFTGTIRHDDSLPAPGWLLFNQNQTPVSPAEPGLTFVPCGGGCGDQPIGTVCYTPPIGVQTLQDDWAGATSAVGGGGRVWTNSNFAGSGITVTETVVPDTGAALLANGVRNTAVSPATQNTVINLGAPRTNVTVRMDFFGSAQGERLRNITPSFTAVSGNGTAVLGNTGVDGGPAADGTVFLTFPGPVQNISWDYSPTGGGLSGQSFISFNTGNAANSSQAAVLRDCDTGETTLVDLATGTDLDPLVISIVDCPGAAAPAGSTQDSEVLVLCDATPTRFLRRINTDPTGTVVSVVNTTLDGTTAFAPVGAVGICTTPVATDFDFAQLTLCDANGTQFIRRHTFNSTTGVVTATTNVTLAGAAFAPVGTVGLCSDCCPAVIGSGCTNTGSGFYTAIRAANGTISLIDSVSGAAVTAGQIVACPGDDTPVALRAQALQLTNAAPWTPAFVSGTLTSLTVTGLAGLWNMTDSNGTALTGLPAGLTLTWTAEDNNSVVPPTDVTPQAGATAVAVWTER